MSVTVDKSRLVLNTFAARFQNALVCSDLVNWNKESGEMNDRNGLVVSEQITPRYTVTETENGVADLSTGVQQTVFGSEQYTLNRTFGTSMGYGDFAKIRDLGDARSSEALKSASEAMANAIDAHILKVAAAAANNWVGNAGETIDDGDEIASAVTRIAEEGVDMRDFAAVMNFTDNQKLGDQVIHLPSPDAMATDTFRNGFSGKVRGVPCKWTQQLSLQETGTRTNGAVAGANQHQDYKDVSISSKNGYFLTQLFNIDGIGANATVKKGEVFTVDNCNAYDNRKQGSLGRSQQFVVVEDAQANAAGEAQLRIFPAFVVPNVEKTAGNAGNNTAHAVVDSIPADNAVVTWKGAASGKFLPRLLIQKPAIRVNTMDLVMPFTGKASRVSLTKVPASVRMWQYSDGNTGEHRVRFDMALTANISDRRRITRVNGN